MKCPWCKSWEGEPKDFLEHLKTCPAKQGGRTVREVLLKKTGQLFEETKQVVEDYRAGGGTLDAAEQSISKFSYALGVLNSIAKELGLEDVSFIAENLMEQISVWKTWSV